MPNTSDKGVERQGDDPQEVQEKDFPSASTSKEEPDKLDDMSPAPIADSGPKEGEEDNKELQKEDGIQSSETPEKKEEPKSTKDTHDESFGVSTRKTKVAKDHPIYLE